MTVPTKRIGRFKWSIDTIQADHANGDESAYWIPLNAMEEQQIEQLTDLINLCKYVRHRLRKEVLK